jgi:hypothetical protein
MLTLAFGQESYVLERARKAQGVPTNYLAIFSPHATLALTPYLHLPLKASTCSTPRLVFSCSDKVVDAKCMRLLQGLYNRKVRLCRVVDVDTT